ncbi:MAG: tRNA (adenosine(37)-N6)-dimethylallyltransferase MiaA [Microthrixaceae bacterium]
MSGLEPVMRQHLVLIGPTASGKSQLAMALAERRLAQGELVELIAVDSMQVYRGMNIGTASPTAQEQERVKHHLIDVADPSEEYSVAEFTHAAQCALDDIEQRGGRAILVGGTALYVQALVDKLELPGRFPEVVAVLEAEPDTSSLYRQLSELDAQAATRMEPSNRRRIIRALEVTIGSGQKFSDFGPGLDAYPETPYALAGLRVDRSVLAERIAARYQQQLRDGFVDEVRALAAHPNGISRTAAQALGYRELLAHLAGDCSLDQAIQAAVDRTRQFAVRQIRWFRRDPRITFLDHVGDPETVLDHLDTLWNSKQQ